MPNNPTDGIDIEYNGHTIKITPLNIKNNIIGEKDSNCITYSNAFGSNTTLRYTPLISGLKEDIILSTYVPNMKYSFSIKANGLYLYNTENGYYLAESQEANTTFILGNVITYDSIGKPSIGTMSIDTINPGYEYIITIFADEAFLSDSSTIYPVTIDPSITISDNTHGSNSIQDSPIFSAKPDQNFGNFLYNSVGTTSSDYGVGRTVVRLNGLINSSDFNSIADYQINSVLFYAKESAGNSSQYINVYPLTSNTSWTESSVTWNNIGNYTTATNFGNHMTCNEWTAFNITNLVKEWKNGTFPASAGFIMMNQNETSNKSFCSSEYATSSARPYVVITYSTDITTNPYYSKYNPDKINNSGTIPSNGTYTNLIQYRMNCYGYALCNILNGSTYYSNGQGYKQQPGEFALTSDKGNTVMNVVTNNPTATMTNVVSNMKLDAKRFGYTMTEYIPSSSTVAQYGTASRLIAVVTGNVDYHFYMQHNDGTWSHKPGSSAITNKSIADNSIVLTNSNIISRANEGIYANGALKFFIITKTAIIDSPHGQRCCQSWPCSHTQSTLYHKELAGDYLPTAKTKLTGGTLARIDFAEDHDVYCFTPTSSKTYTVSSVCASGADLDCKIYDNTGKYLNASITEGQLDMTINLIAGKKYYIEVYNYDKSVTDYTFVIE